MNLYEIMHIVSVLGYQSISVASLNWTEAESECQTHFGSSLASIFDSSENDEAASLCWSSCWLGGNDISVDGVWVWSADTAFGSYTNWIPGEPSNSAGGEDCLEMMDHGKWNDVSCSQRSSSQNIICDDPPTANPTVDPTSLPTEMTLTPSLNPTQETYDPTYSPTFGPSKYPTSNPIYYPSGSPTEHKNASIIEQSAGSLHSISTLTLGDVFAIVGVALFCPLIVGICIYYRKQKRKQVNLEVKYAVVHRQLTELKREVNSSSVDFDTGSIATAGTSITTSGEI